MILCDRIGSQILAESLNIRSELSVQNPFVDLLLDNVTGMY